MQKMDQLLSIQSEWISEFDEIRKERGELACPFVSVPDPQHQRGSLRPILMVGQATSGPWFPERFRPLPNLSVFEVVEERRKTTLHFLTDPMYDPHKSRSSYWRLFKELKNRTSAPVIWTNLAKIGTIRGNPKWQLVKRQASLAIKTLRAEIACYNPALVLLVTGIFGRHEITTALVGLDRDTRSNEGGVFCSRSHTSSSPAILWTWHPARPPRGTRTSTWIEEAARLYEAALNGLANPAS
ncbi:MAG: hypothetical protein ABR956_05630 [Terracidiphilus sp.]|jgi:hypothetical protein